MANFWHILANLPKLISAVKALANNITRFHTDPAIVAAIEASPALKALSEDISREARDIQEAIK